MLQRFFFLWYSCEINHELLSNSLKTNHLYIACVVGANGEGRGRQKTSFLPPPRSIPDFALPSPTPPPYSPVLHPLRKMHVQ